MFTARIPRISILKNLLTQRVDLTRVGYGKDADKVLPKLLQNAMRGAR